MRTSGSGNEAPMVAIAIVIALTYGVVATGGVQGSLAAAERALQQVADLLWTGVLGVINLF